MPTLLENMEQLQDDKDNLADNLTLIGIPATSNESFASLVAKVSNATRCEIGSISLAEDSHTLSITNNNIDFVPTGIMLCFANLSESEIRTTGIRTVSAYIDGTNSYLNAVHPVRASLTNYVSYDAAESTVTATFNNGITVSTGKPTNSDDYKFKAGTWLYIVWK